MNPMRTSKRRFFRMVRENYAALGGRWIWNSHVRDFYSHQYDLFAAGVRDGRLHDDMILLIDAESQAS